MRYGDLRKKNCVVRCIALVAIFSTALHAADPAPSSNLALGRPATSSSFENDDHNAPHANDGKNETCWTADDEPEGEPDWWQVDLGGSFDLGVAEITWPFDRMNYRCRVDGSADGKQWHLLSDQTKTKSRDQIQRLNFNHASAVRYVRVTITGFDTGCCAGIREVKVFGSSHPGS